MNFLRETYTETGSLRNWLPPRFENSAKGNEADTRIWETHGGKIVAMATPEEKLCYFMQVHPDYASLDGKIIKWIEEHSAEQSHGKKLSIISLEGNPTREEALRAGGFEKGKIYGILRLRDPKIPIKECRLPDGFKIRSVDPENDLRELAQAVRTVFGHGEWFNEEVLRELSWTSFYHSDLDLVAVDEHGAIASFCTFRLDEPSGITELEPMGTLPGYRGLGIAKALLNEGFRRLAVHNPMLLYIGGAANTPAANRLYEATGFTTRHDYYYWQKTLP